MRQANENDVLVTVQVQAPDDEIEDLVALVVARLEGGGLELVERGVTGSVEPGQGAVELVLRPSPWLG
jgi:hypothetical protein